MRNIYPSILVFLFIGIGTFVNAQTTWYLKNTGDWNVATNWTQDPAAAITIPSGGGIPADNDNIVIPSGKSVTVPDALILTQGIVTVIGDLDLATSSGHTFSKLKGNGRMLIASNNYPTITDDSDFISSDEDAGTIVLYGNSFSLTGAPTFCHLEIDMTSGQTLTLESDLTLNGNLTISTGEFKINNGGTTALNVTVKGDVSVESTGSMSVGTGAAFHWMNVYGDFVNNGTIDFTNSAQYVEATDGAVKLKFLGETDNNFVCNNTTALYRLFVDKGTDKTYKISVTADDNSNFTLNGPVDDASYSGLDGTDGTIGYERLPIVLENGTLELGSNIVINRLGEDIDGSAPSEFTIPESGSLWVNGATITTYDETAYAAEPWKAPTDWQGITIFGELKVSSGSITIPENANGIRYYDNLSYPASLKIEGGTISITQLFQYNSNGRLNYSQSGGVFEINALPTNNWGAPAFQMPHEDQVFTMSGGSIEFSSVNKNNVTAFYVASAIGNYNVTGGTITINTPTDSPEGNDVRIYSTVPLYNLLITGNASGQIVQVTDQYGGTSNPSELNILNDLTIEANNTFNDGGFAVSIGRNLTIAGTYSQTGGLIFNGDQNGEIINNTGSDLTLPYLYINKDRYPVADQFYTISLTGADNIEIDGTLKLIRGALDVVDFWPLVTDSVVIEDGNLTSSGSGGLELTGTSQQILKGKFGKDQDFGRLKLNNSGSSPQIKLASNIDVATVEFIQDQVFDLDIYNIDIESSVYTDDGSWDSSKMFRTAGNSSDGGLTLPVTVSGDYGSNTDIQYFPLGTPSRYSYCLVYANGTGLSDSGKLTVRPVEGDHPTVDPTKSVVAFYYRIFNDGLSTVDGSELGYKFLIPTTWGGSSYKGMVLNNSVWGEYNINKDLVSGGNTHMRYLLNSSPSMPLEGDYTVGNQSAFTTVRTLYSRQSGSFNNKNTWSESGHSGSATNKAPASYDYCIVGGITGTNHTVTIDANNADASQITILGNSDLGNSGTPPTLYVESGTTGHDIELIKGNGRLVYENNYGYNSSYVHINGDHSEFCSSSEAIIEYTSTSGSGPHRIPSDSDVPFYPNLVISETSGETRPTNSMDLIVLEDLEVNSGTFFLDGNYDQYISIGGDLIINNGTLTHEAIGIRYMEVEGDISFTGTGTFNTNGSTENLLYLKGDIILANGNLDFDGSGDLTVYWQGDESSNYSTTNTNAVFSRIEINKTTDQSVTFNSDFDLNGSTNGSTKALELISGDCILNNSGIDIDLTTGSNDFEIPSGSKLYVTDGAVNASGNSGVKLDGSLIINGGIANIDGSTAGGGSSNSSYIEFTSSGDSYLEVSSSGTLNVGDQIRRAASSEEWVLTFVQNNGTVNIGTVGDDLDNTRGMFEILGTGSSFSQADNDIITIERSNGSTSIPTLYFDPETVSYGSGSGITIDGSAVTSETFVLYANQNLNDFTITGGTGNIAQLKTVEHTIDGTLTIGANATFDANGLDLYVNGDFVNDGTYTASNNTLYFNGSSDQSISGSGTNDFYDVVLNSGNTLNTGSDLTITNDLTISSGTLNTGTNVVNVEGDIVNNGSTLSTSGDGIILNNTSGSQSISGSGSYQNLTIDNADGVVMPSQSSAITITGVLKLEDGIFDIGRNLMEVTNNATFDPGSSLAFSSSNMIQTNLSFTDAGINKTFNNDETGDFVYPVGSFGLYTPVTINVVANGNSTGSIRVKAANEPHVTISGTDLDHVLQYNWTLDADGITGFKGEITMQADASDEAGDATDYIGVRFELGGTHVSRYEDDALSGYDAYDHTTHQLFVDFNKIAFLTDDDIDGDYTAGESTIDYDVQAFISVADGDWTDGATWDYYDPDTETTSENNSAFPNGAIVYIADGTTVTMDVDELVSYGSYIQGTGRLEVGTTQNHRIGSVSGTGTLSVESGSLPAGVYTDFVSSSGGTLEYAGTFSESILSETSVVNNLTLLGSGTRTLPNYPTEGVTLYGDLTINGPTLEAYSAQDLQIQGDVIFTSGNFDANNANVIINGSSLQDISGATDFTSASGGEFYNLEIDNTSGVTISNDIEISNIITLTDGVIFTDAGGSLNVTNSLSAAVVGGSSSSYVQGPMSKVISDGDSFTFPMGDQSRYLPLIVTTDGLDGTPETWEVQYYSHNPNDDGFDVTSMTGSVAYVSHGEYWRVLGPDTETAKVTLNWDDLSGVNPDDSDFRVVTWTDLATDAWAEVAIGTPSGTTTSGYVQTSGYETFNGFVAGSYYTFGSITVPAYQWEGDVSVDWFTAGNWSSSIVPGASADVTIVSGTYAAEIDGTASVNALTITTGAVTLKPGAILTVNGDLTTNNNLTVQNSVTSPTSIITNGSVSGEATYEWTGLTNMYWWHIGHPVTGVDDTEYDASLNDDVADLNDDYALNSFTTSGWSRVAGISGTDGYDFDADLLEGYALLIRYADQTLSYAGVLNNLSSYSQNYSQAEWYLIANPYPSYIDVEDAGFDIGNFLKTVFIDGYDNTISTYNILTNVGVNGGTRYVAPGQAMWLRTYEATDAISIANTTRVHSTGSLKATTAEDDNIFRFTLGGSNNTDESVVLVSSEFGSELVSEFDSEKMMNGGNLVNVYSIKQSKDISINALPEISSEQVVPLGYSVSSEGMGEFTFKASNINSFMNGVDVYLVDNTEGITINLREEPSYTFTPSSAESNDRFELRFEASLTTDIDEQSAVVSDKNVIVYSVKQNATVKVTEDVLNNSDRSIDVYDVSGQLVKQIELNDQETTFTLPQTNMVYIINVTAGGDSYRQKVVSQE